MPIEATDRQLSDVRRLFQWRIPPDADCAGWHDPRLALFRSAVDVRGKRVLEPGCYEGVLTCALAAAGADVTATDVRPTCVLKTFTRALLHGYRVHVLMRDAGQLAELGPFDVIFHAGMFYHLDDPISHLRSIAHMAPLVFLDAHTARPGAETDQLHGYRGMWYGEYGWEDEYSGTEARSFWLAKPDLLRLFADSGFRATVLLDDDAWENGPRSCYLLSRECGQGTF